MPSHDSVVLVLVLTIYGGPNLNGAGKQLRLANGYVKDTFSSVGREQIPAYP